MTAESSEVASSAEGTTTATPAAGKKRGRPVGSRNKSTLERLAREAAERGAEEEARRLMTPEPVVAAAARDAGDAAVEEWGQVINLSGPTVRCVAVLPADPGSEVGRQCSRRSFPGRDKCLTHVRAEAESALVDMLQASEQSVIEAQLALREAARTAVETLVELTGAGYSPTTRMRSAVALVEASGASLARTGPQTVVVAGEATVLSGEKAVEDASRTIKERLDRLAAGMTFDGARSDSEGPGGALEVSLGADGVWGLPGGSESA